MNALYFAMVNNITAVNVFYYSDSNFDAMKLLKTMLALVAKQSYLAFNQAQCRLMLYQSLLCF